ncbi:hypothetical protein [Paenibacillus sp. FSL M7-0420]|uniref:hypothetical protein n=1 Tax=Paenibacillus sp. FSL M7-0420 TaxID=2921609 RepID=UPI0030FBF8EB
MTFKETIELFMNQVSDSSYEIYKNKIMVFYKFLVSDKGINDKSYKSYLEAMKTEEVIESLNYYIIANKINSESVAWHYISVIKRYFLFIYDAEKLIIQNANLIKSFSLSNDSKDSFTYKIKKEIFESGDLEKKDSKTELTQEEVEVLISECDQQIKELLEGDSILKYPSQYNDFVSCIIIKLLLFTGAKYQVIINLRLSDLNLKQQILRINGYYIRLPINLFTQLQEYVAIKKQMQSDCDNKDNFLFTRFDGEKLKGTSFISDTLVQFTGRGDTTGIIKFAIIEMIKRGINQSLIQDFTGNGSKIYDYCQSKVNESKNLSVNRYLDSKLRSLEIYDLL